MYTPSVHRAVFLLLGLALLQSPHGSVYAAHRRAADAEVLAASDARHRAQVAHDVEKISSSLAEDFVHVDGREVIRKDDYLKRYWYSGNLRPSAQTLKDPIVFGKGDVLFVSGILIDEGRFNGHEFHSQFRFTQAYRKTGNKWLCVFDQASPAPSNDGAAARSGPGVKQPVR